MKPKVCVKERQHPAQKPIDLLKRLILKSSSENDIVFDGMCGSGSTLVACKQLNRNFIGIEINPEYCRTAEQRLKRGKGLF